MIIHFRYHLKLDYRGVLGGVTRDTSHNCIYVKEIAKRLVGIL